MFLKRILVITCFLLAGKLYAQNPEFVQEYINSYKELAMQEMIRTGVPASIKLAQGIHETEAGRSDLVQRSNNHFGIKCKTGWSGGKVYHDDDERGECFRSYSSATDSYMDHSDFLKNSQRYASLFTLDPEDYKAWAFGLKKAGYATNIKYSQILIKIIETYNLQQYSLIALGKLPPGQEIMAGKNAAVTKEVSTPTLPVPPLKEETIAAPKINYPEGEFLINNTRVIYAKAGTSMLELAQKFEIPFRRLLDFNDLGKEEILIEPQLVFLQRKRKTGNNDFHIVATGEKLYDISQLEGIRLESLLKYNHLEANMEPATGEKLYLKEMAPARPRLWINETGSLKQATAEETVQAKEQTPALVHTVSAKETLYSIAKNYGVTTEGIKAWNKLSGNTLKEGQELIIYKN